MVLPELTTVPVQTIARKNSIVVSQKIMKKGLLFAATYKGNSTVSLGDNYALNITRLSDDRIDIKLLQYDIEAKSYTNIPYQYRPKAKKKVPAKKKPKFTKKKEEGCATL